jgi:hypothetical protein
LWCWECLLFTILPPFGIRKSIKWKVNHGGQIVLWYRQHATNLAKTMFVVCMSSARVLVWVRGRAKQKCSLSEFRVITIQPQKITSIGKEVTQFFYSEKIDPSLIPT